MKPLPLAANQKTQPPAAVKAHVIRSATSAEFHDYSRNQLAANAPAAPMRTRFFEKKSMSICWRPTNRSSSAMRVLTC